MITEKGAWGVVKPSVNLYVIPGKDGIIYDAGYADRKSVRYFLSEFQKIKKECARRSQACEINRIIISHAHEDHFSGLHILRKKLGVSIMLSAKTATYIASKKKFRETFDTGLDPSKIPLPKFLVRGLNRLYKLPEHMVKFFAYNCRYLSDPDIVFDGKTEININDDTWQIFPSPGHSSDHITLYNPQTGVLFSGDNVLRTITTWLGPPDSSLSAYMETLKHMLALPKLELILSAHGSPVTKPKERIQELIDWRLERTRQVYEAVQKSGKRGVTLKDLFNTFYKKSGSITYFISTGWIQLTIAYLVEKQVVAKNKIGKISKYYCVGSEGADAVDRFL